MNLSHCVCLWRFSCRYIEMTVSKLRIFVKSAARFSICLSLHDVWAKELTKKFVVVIEIHHPYQQTACARTRRIVESTRKVKVLPSTSIVGTYAQRQRSQSNWTSARLLNMWCLCSVWLNLIFHWQNGKRLTLQAQCRQRRLNEEKKPTPWNVNRFENLNSLDSIDSLARTHVYLQNLSQDLLSSKILFL